MEGRGSSLLCGWEGWRSRWGGLAHTEGWCRLAPAVRICVVPYRGRCPPPQTRSSRHEVKLWDGMGMSRGPVVTWEQATRGRFNHAGSRVRGWRLLPLLLRGKDGAWGKP